MTIHSSPVSAARFPGGSREHGASQRVGLRRTPPRAYPKHTASQDTAGVDDDTRWPLAAGP